MISIWRSTWEKSIFFRQYLKSWLNNDISSIIHFIVKNLIDISFYIVQLQIKENSIFIQIYFAFLKSSASPVCQLAVFLIFERKNRQRVIDKILLLLCHSLIELKLRLRLSWDLFVVEVELRLRFSWGCVDVELRMNLSWSGVELGWGWV